MSEEELRAAIEAELCNGNWLYLGRGDPIGHVLRAVKSVLIIKPPRRPAKPQRAKK